MTKQIIKTELQDKLAKLPKRVTKAITDKLTQARTAIKAGDIATAKLLIMNARIGMDIVRKMPQRIAATKGVIAATLLPDGYIVTVDDGSAWPKRIIAVSVRDFERQLRAVTAWKSQG